MSCCFKFKSNKVIDNPVRNIIEEEEYFDEEYCSDGDSIEEFEEDYDY